MRSWRENLRGPLAAPWETSVHKRRGATTTTATHFCGREKCLSAGLGPLKFVVDVKGRAVACGRQLSRVERAWVSGAPVARGSPVFGRPAGRALGIGRWASGATPRTCCLGVTESRGEALPL